jgi:hypothetical protein
MRCMKIFHRTYMIVGEVNKAIQNEQLNYLF